MFPRVGPLIVEIGFGNGDFLLNLAESNPDCSVIGFEISSQSMDKAEAKIAKRGLENVRPIHGRAETALAHLLAPESVQAFHINNPDPWFKKRHERRRLIKRGTVDLLTSRLARGGLLHLATDVREYAEAAHAVLAGTPGLSNRLEAPWVDEIAGRMQTKYEIKGYREGRSSHFFCYERNEAAVRHPPVVEELDMPHLFLQSHLDAAEIIERFEPTRSAAGGAHVAILQAYANPSKDSAVFEVVVEEPTIEQHALLSLTPREAEGEYIVKLTAVGHARPTDGMHRAVEAVGEWVAGLDAGGMVLARKLRGVRDCAIICCLDYAEKVRTEFQVRR